jgi:transcriptional regulator with XRE-family HTH domain
MATTPQRTPLDLQKDIGVVLRAFRRTRRLHQAHVAHAAGTSIPHLSKIENGGTDVGVDLLNRLLLGLGISWQEFGRAVDTMTARRMSRK